MLIIRKIIQPKLSDFISYFLSLMFFLPISIGSLLVHFAFIYENFMWGASVLLSAFVAAYWVVSE